MQKKLLVVTVFAGCAILGSCGGGESNSNAATDSAAAAPAASTMSPEAEKGLALVAQSDCLTCHKVEDQSTGPAYRAIAAKYPADDATIDMLAGKIIQGGSGNWGQVPMTAHPQLSKEDARLMAKYVMSLKK